MQTDQYKQASPTSNNKAWVTGDVAVELTADVYDYNVLSPQLFGKRYKIIHDFIVPYYYDGETENLEDTTTPPDLYNGNSSVKYISQSVWLRDPNDPNTGITTVLDDSIGSSGYLDESFNGDENPYSIDNLMYTNVYTGLETDRLQIGEKVRVNFNVNNSFGNFTPSQIGVVAHGAILDGTEYRSSKKTFSELWSFETVRGNSGSNNIITNYSLTYNNNGNISVQFDAKPQAENLKEDQYYVLVIQLRNDNQNTIAESHKAHVLIDYNKYGKNNDIEGLFGVERFEQIPHPVDYSENVTGYTNAQSNIEEGLLSYSEFWLDTSKDAKIEDLSFNVGIINTVTDNVTFLRSENIDLSNSIKVGDNWQLSLDETVGYPLKEGDQFNYKKLITGDKIGVKQFYKLIVGYKIPWAEWRDFKDAPNVFLMLLSN